jgi:hypothetical protein
MGGPTESVPVRSVQEARLGAADGELDLRAAERMPEAYWRYLRRRFVGVIRAVDAPERPAIVLLTRRLPLLRFGATRAESGEGVARVSLAIEGGLLLARAGKWRGVLSFELAAPPPDAEQRGVIARGIVDGYQPRLCAPGPLLGTRTWIYAKTQLRLHVAVMRGFLRSLAERPRIGGRDQWE